MYRVMVRDSGKKAIVLAKTRRDALMIARRAARAGGKIRIENEARRGFDVDQFEALCRRSHSR